VAINELSSRLKTAIAAASTTTLASTGSSPESENVFAVLGPLLVLRAIPFSINRAAVSTDSPLGHTFQRYVAAFDVLANNLWTAATTISSRNVQRLCAELMAEFTSWKNLRDLFHECRNDKGSLKVLLYTICMFSVSSARSARQPALSNTEEEVVAIYRLLLQLLWQQCQLDSAVGADAAVQAGATEAVSAVLYFLVAMETAKVKVDGTLQRSSSKVGAIAVRGLTMCIRQCCVANSDAASINATNLQHDNGGDDDSISSCSIVPSVELDGASPNAKRTLGVALLRSIGALIRSSLQQDNIAVRTRAVELCKDALQGLVADLNSLDHQDQPAADIATGANALLVNISQVRLDN